MALQPGVHGVVVAGFFGKEDWRHGGRWRASIWPIILPRRMPLASTDQVVGIRRNPRTGLIVPSSDRAMGKVMPCFRPCRDLFRLFLDVDATTTTPPGRQARRVACNAGISSTQGGQ